MQQNNFEVKKIRHSVVTDNYSAIEEIQSQIWQYFVEYVLGACRGNSIREKKGVKQAQLMNSNSENITICKKDYQSFYNQVAQNLNLTNSNLTADEMSEINQGLQRGNYWLTLKLMIFWIVGLVFILKEVDFQVLKNQ